MKRGVLALALLMMVTATALAGCVSGFGSQAQPPEGPRPCFLSTASAEWTQPGLYDALPAMAEAADIHLRPEGARSELPLTHPDFAATWPNASVTSITWNTGNHSERFVLSAIRPGEVHVWARYIWDDEDMLRKFGTFLAYTGLADVPERPAWERQLVQTRGEGPWPQATFLAQPRVDAFVDLMGGPSNATLEDHGYGGVTLHWTNWSMRLQLPTWRLTTEASEGRAFDLIVGTMDHALIHVDIGRDDPPHATLQAAADETFARLGMEAPMFQDVRAGAGAC